MENIENKIPNGENQDTQNSSFFSENVSSSNGLEAKFPLLRFRKFSHPWKQEKLSNFTSRIMRKNSNNETELPLTISSKDGLVDQVTFFNKKVSSKDMSGYYLLKNGEFAYNKSYSNGYDFGSIKRLERYEMGALSTLYICFSLKKHCSDYIKHYFDSLKWYRQIYVISAEGARNHGLLNVPTDDFFATTHYLSPYMEEQQKIANFLSLVDQRIEKQRQLVESLKKYKRGYFQRIISSLETSSFELKNIVDEYNAKSKIQNEFPILSSTLSGIKLQNDYFNKQAASETTIGYKIVPFGYFTYRSMSDTGEFRFNLQNIIEKGIVSPAYPVFKVKEEYNAEFVEYILNETDNIKSQLLIKKEGGTRYALSFSKFQTLKIDLPIKNAQDKTVSQLRFINKVLTNEERILSNLQKLKNGLLQQMFI